MRVARLAMMDTSALALGWAIDLGIRERAYEASLPTYENTPSGGLRITWASPEDPNSWREPLPARFHNEAVVLE